MEKSDIETKNIDEPKPRKRVSVYIKLSGSTFRYQRLMELAQEYNCSHHRIALNAIDWYLRTQAPKRE